MSVAERTTYVMTDENMERFVTYEREQGASANMLRRFSWAIRSLYQYLPKDKIVTKELLPATRLLLGNTLSCKCLQKECFRRMNKYIDNTSLRQTLEEKVESRHAVSG